MSSTNRGAERSPADFYVTPIDAVETFLREWAKDEPGLRNVKRVLDPCAGGIMREGKTIVPMSYPEALHCCPDIFPDAHLSTVDIRPDSCAETVGDWITRPAPRLAPDLIISNPPFYLAVPFIRHALYQVADGGFVVFLLRLNFFGGQERRKLFHAGFGMPKACYVHAERMKFLQWKTELPAKQRNATDSIEYAHFVWQKGCNPRFTQLRVI